MYLPCEIFVKEFLPALRGLMAHELRDRGLSQSRIASLLGVSQAAVSQILSRDRSEYRRRIEIIGFGDGEVDALIRILVNDSASDPILATQMIHHFWHDALERGVICGYHRKLYPQLVTCSICLRREEMDIEVEETVRRVEEAVGLLESSNYVSYLVPEVAMNIAQAVRQAKTVEDVVGIPGRIVEVRGRVKAVSRPEPGGSKHLAQILLKISDITGIRAVINIKLDPRVESAVKSLGLKYATTRYESPPKSEDEVVEAVAECLREKGVLDAVLDWGGMGLEPTTYVFGRDAVDAARKVLRIAAEYLSKA